jgi:hypothetical protein
LSALSATSASLGGSRAVAVALIVAFLLLAFAFSVLAYPALRARLRDCVQAARRLGGGDFSLPIKAEGGGEELELILPHSDLEGAHAIAERNPAAVEEPRCQGLTPPAFCG